ncbi:MAG TPA: ABC transporter substrate-binding protein [Rhizomicrobium sp.]
MSGFCEAVGFVLIVACVPAQAAPQRVVSTHLCADEYVFRLVPRDHIAALSYLAGDTSPVVSTIADKVKGIELIHASTEDVLTRSPDLVVLYEGTNPRLRSHLVEAHVPFIEIPWAESLAQVREVTRRLGAELGAPERASAMLKTMDRELADARADKPVRPVATLVYEPNGYATVGGVTDEVMAAAGLSNAAPSMNPTRSGTIPIEAVIAAAPELLILNGTNGRTRSEADLVLQHPALTALDRKTFVATLALTPLLCPGPWSAEEAPMFAQLGREALARNKTSP